jgi:hypothetical protein
MNRYVIGAAAAVAALAGAATWLAAQPPAPSAAPGAEELLIDFESVADARRLPGRLLGDRYRQSRGARFGAGAHAVLCGATNAEEVAATGVVPPCAYPTGASGDRAGYFDGSADALVIDFDRPIRSLNLRANLPSMHSGQSYRIVITGHDGAGQVAASETAAGGSVDLAPGWPTTATLSSDAPFARVRVRALYDGTGEFLFDDVRFQPAVVEAPVAAAIFAPQPPTEFTTVEDRDSVVAVRIYPSATRVRAAIDWDLAMRHREAQRAAGIEPQIPADRRMLDEALLPVLLPTAVDGGAVTVSSSGDTVNAAFSHGGRDYSVYGSRVMTVLPGAAPSGGFAVRRGEFSVAATFSLYGAAYELERYCAGDSGDDPGCGDEQALKDVARSLAVAVGAAGERRP